MKIIWTNQTYSKLRQKWLVLNNFYYILIAVTCEFSISPKKYRKFCKDTFNLYMKTYPWYPMSPTVHKILVHGADIINLCIVPVGCLCENASEARNKHYKMDRRSHARKNSRLSNMADAFNRAMDSSDPLISSYYINKRLQNLKKKPLPIEVINLLENPTSELSSYNFFKWWRHRIRQRKRWQTWEFFCFGWRRLLTFCFFKFGILLKHGKILFFLFLCFAL